jgi:NADH dehydrogenase
VLVIPTLELMEADVHYVSELSTHFRDCDAVVNLTGILNPGAGEANSFEQVHARLPEKVIEACRFNGIRRLLHMSALNADPEGPSAYLQSKGRGEAAVTAATDLHTTVFRPSVVFGAGDSFLNRFAGILRLAPVVPLASPATRFAPVYVGDVVSAFVHALDDRDTFGRSYDLCGPRVYTLQELVEYTGRTIGKRRWVFGLGPKASRWQAHLMEYMPGAPLTRDNLLSMSQDNVCAGNGLDALGITPTALEAIAPSYLAGQGRETRYTDFRIHARRD